MNTEAEEEAARFAARHGLEKLRAQDPSLFATLMVRTAVTGRALPREANKEFPPAPLFRPGADH